MDKVHLVSEKLNPIDSLLRNSFIKKFLSSKNVFPIIADANLLASFGYFSWTDSLYLVFFLILFWFVLSFVFFYVYFYR